jgi:hypothetical protein
MAKKIVSGNNRKSPQLSFRAHFNETDVSLSIIGILRENPSTALVSETLSFAGLIYYSQLLLMALNYFH